MTRSVIDSGQHFDHAMLDDTDMDQATLAKLLQQRAHAGSVYFHPEVVIFGVSRGEQGLA